VPASSAAREFLSLAARHAGLRVVESPEAADLALVDLTAPGGADAAAALLDSPSAARLSLLALVESGEKGFAAAERLRPAEVLTAAGLPHELGWRLSRVAGQHREREALREQVERERAARVAAEERVAALRTYHLYFDCMSEGVAILDDKACVLGLNPAGAAMLDTFQEAAHGKHILQLTQPVDEGALMELVVAASRGESRADVDVNVRTPSGRGLTLCMSAATLNDGAATTLLSFRDVTQSRRLGEELRHTKEFLERLIDSSVDAIIASDLQGRIILFNKGAEAMSGYTAQEAMSGLHVEQLYPSGVAKRIMGQLRAPDFGGRGRLSMCRQELVNRAGERVPVNMTASILYEGGREVASVGIFTDLRDRMQLERKLSDVENRLEESEKSAVIVALAGTAAHELNQPLTSIMGYAELLKRKLKETDSAYKPVDIIYRESERMAEIVRKIGRITRYETKAYIGSQQIVDLDKASSHEE
jgi:PAS domain S-box-containing protein